MNRSAVLISFGILASFLADARISPDIPQPCALSCQAGKLGDGICHPECLNSACGYDGNDCAKLLCPEDCITQIGSRTCSQECNTEICKKQLGDCSISTPTFVQTNFVTSECPLGCLGELKNNGECNIRCNIKACDFDGGECINVAPRVIIDPIPIDLSQWNYEVESGDIQQGTVFDREPVISKLFQH